MSIANYWTQTLGIPCSGCHRNSLQKELFPGEFLWQFPRQPEGSDLIFMFKNPCYRCCLGWPSAGIKFCTYRCE